MSAPLDLDGDVVELLRALVDVESVSGHEKEIADLVEQALRRYSHLVVLRDGNVVLARTELGRSERVVIAGHLDTVPVAGNLPSWTTHDDTGRKIIWGRGACDMKGGVAVQLAVAAALRHSERDITWVFYDNEEVEEYRNGLARISREHPDYLSCTLAVLCEPSNAGIEGGCQGSMQLQVELQGVAAPQTIDQTHLYGGAVRWFVDPGVPDEGMRSTWRYAATARRWSHPLGTIDS